MGDLREGSNMQADLYFVHASWTVSSRNGISYNGNKYFKGNLRAIEYTFLLSALNLCTPMQGLCIVIFLQANAWTAHLSPWEMSLLFAILRSKSATTIVKLFRERMPPLPTWLLSLKRTRDNQQMKWKLRKLLAPKESYLSVLPLVDHSLSTYYPNLLTINHPFEKNS